MSARACLLGGDDLVVDLRVAPAEESAAVDHHVDLVSTGGNRVGDLGELDRERALTRGESRRDRCDLDAAAGEPRDGGRYEVRVDADRRHRGHPRIGGVGTDRLGAERCDLAGRVLPLEGGQVAAANRELEREALRLALDAALRELGRARLDADLVDGPDSSRRWRSGSSKPTGSVEALATLASVALAPGRTLQPRGAAQSPSRSSIVSLRRQRGEART